MTQIILYSKANCAYCTWAKQLLESKKLHFEEIRIDLDPEKRVEMEQLTGKRTTPQIIINHKPIGGYDDLVILAKSGQLEELLKSH